MIELVGKVEIAFHWIVVAKINKYRDQFYPTNIKK